jgi:hypothetical protein
MRLVQEAVGFSWMDILIPLTLIGVLYAVYRRKFFGLIGWLAAGYLFFFWSWGLNYHREPVSSKLDFHPEWVDADTVAGLTVEAALALNSLYRPVPPEIYTADYLSAEATWRVGRVIAELDGTFWPAGSAVKSSRILDPFFRAAGVDGMFNPFGHEALVVGGLLPVELPMVVLHEVAHVRGYPDEGDANFIALMGALGSEDPVLQYSGWLTLWLYLRSQEFDPLLEAGPRADVEAIYARVAGNRIDWVSRAQRRSLDTFLKAHDVREGVRSYARIVTLAVGTRPEWDRFRD